MAAAGKRLSFDNREGAENQKGAFLREEVEKEDEEEEDEEGVMAFLLSLITFLMHV